MKRRPTVESFVSLHKFWWDFVFMESLLLPEIFVKHFVFWSWLKCKTLNGLTIESEWKWEKVKHVTVHLGNQSVPFFSSQTFRFLSSTTCTLQRSQHASNDWDANLSWHVKLWLDQITRRSTVNGQAERLPLYTEGGSRLSFQYNPVTLLLSVILVLIDKLIARFQSNISSGFAKISS